MERLFHHTGPPLFLQCALRRTSIRFWKRQELLGIILWGNSHSRVNLFFCNPTKAEGSRSPGPAELTS